MIYFTPSTCSWEGDGDRGCLRRCVTGDRYCWMHRVRERIVGFFEIFESKSNDSHNEEMTTLEYIFVMGLLGLSGKSIAAAMYHAQLITSGAESAIQTVSQYLFFFFLFLSGSSFLYLFVVVKIRRLTTLRGWNWMLLGTAIVAIAGAIYRHSENPVVTWMMAAAMFLAVVVFRPLHTLEKRTGLVAPWMALAGCVLLGAAALWPLVSTCVSIISPSANHVALPEESRSSIYSFYIANSIYVSFVFVDTSLAIFITGRLLTPFFLRSRAFFRMKGWKAYALSVVSVYIVFCQGMLLFHQQIPLWGHMLPAWGCIGVVLGGHYWVYRRLKAREESEGGGGQGGRRSYAPLPPR